MPRVARLSRSTLRPLAMALSVALVPLAASSLGAAEAAEPGGSSDWLHALTGLDGASLAAPIRALLIVTVLGVAPSAVLLMTCFPRVVIVLSFLRRALGAQDLPPNLVVTGLALLLTVSVMMPVWNEVYTSAYRPLVETRELTFDEAIQRAEAPIKRFMLAHTLRNDRDSLRLFVRLAGEPSESETASAAERRVEDLPFSVVLPAFVLSELKVAFQLGFLIYLPFVVIDLVVSAVLVSMGMFMLPPNLVSLPLKVLVFVMVDGWSLLVTQLAAGLRVGA